MEAYLNIGDVVTFLESQMVKVTYGKKAATEFVVASGDVWSIDEPTKIIGETFHVSAPKVPRTISKRAYRQQPVRTCDVSLATLELPDTSDPLVRDLEARLEMRGAAMKARLLAETQKLKA